MCRGKHLDAVDLDGLWPSLWRHQLNQRRRVTRDRLKRLAVPVVDGPGVTGLEIGKPSPLPDPAIDMCRDGRYRQPQIQRALDVRHARLQRSEQGLVLFRG